MANTAQATGPGRAADPVLRPQPATPSTARAINDRAALDLFVSRGPLTALDLAEATGLAKPTVADLLGRLQEVGLVDQVGEVKTDKRGPNAKLYALSGRRACVAGIDARAEVVHLSLAGLAGQRLGESTLQVPPDLPEDAVLDRLADTLLALADGAPAPLAAVTIGMPGLVDPATGQIGGAKMSPSWHTRLAEVVRVRTGLDPTAVLLENEVNLAAIAEHLLLAEQGVDTFALIWLGTGVGAALMLDGRLRRGASGGAGEIGYLPVASAAVDGPPGPVRMLDCGVGGLIWSGALADLAERLPPAEVLPAVAERVMFGVAAFAVTVDPGLVVLGGENGAAGGLELARLVERRLAEFCPVPTRVLPTAVPGDRKSVV